MAHIVADRIAVDFPVYEASDRSFKTTLMRTATGGRVVVDSASHRVSVRALNELTFALREGDRVGLVGHNGSGKSTLLRVLTGAYEPISGTLDISGRVASMLNVWVGMSLDATGYENIFLRGAIMGFKRAQIETLIGDIEEFSELGSYMHMPLRTYSSGMAMRLAFAVSTSISADIILMDEWLSAGDASFAKKAQRRLEGLLDRAKIFVVASHNEQLIGRMCNKIMRLDHGNLVAFEQIDMTDKEGEPAQ